MSVIAPDRSHPTLLVVGPGAVGCLLAAKAAMAGIPVQLLDYRPARARTLQNIELIMPGETHQVPLSVSADPGCARHARHIVICVKAFQTHTVMQQIRPYVSSQALVLSLQNGLGNLSVLQALPCRDVRAAVLHAGVLRLSPTRVRTTGGNLIELAGQADNPLAQQWADTLDSARFRLRLAPDTDRMLWSKLVLNAAINPVTALYGIPNGELLTHPEAADLAEDLLRESSHIARHTGIALDEDTNLRKRLVALCEQTAHNRSSMLCDVEAGRPTEINEINGAILRHARANSLDAPITASLLKRFQQQFG